MVIFEDNQFEIAIATYKRPEYVESWLEKCYQSAKERNITISVYDSSPDEKTSDVVNRFSRSTGANINYHKVDEKTIIGYKPMIPIMETKSEYLWVSGDSRYHNFNELDEKVFPYIKERKIEYIVINIGNNYQLPDTVYTDKGEMIHDTFIASTCIGLSIYKISIFDILKNDTELKSTCDRLFKTNYGFGWLGYFYHAYASGDYKTLLVNVETLSVLQKKKTQSWAVRFYGCWVDDLCQIIDNIPEIYIGKDQIPKNTWKVMRLNSSHYRRLARKHGDLNAEKYEQLLSSGLINRITEKPNMIKFYAKAPVWMIEIDYFSHKIARFGIRIMRKIRRK